MTSRKNSVRVFILGEEYTLRSAATEEETRAVAGAVDRQIREIMDAGLVVETHKAAVLACLRLAGELMQLRAERRDDDETLAALCDEIRPWLPPARRHD